MAFAYLRPDLSMFVHVYSKGGVVSLPADDKIPNINVLYKLRATICVGVRRYLPQYACKESLFEFLRNVLRF